MSESITDVLGLWECVSDGGVGGGDMSVWVLEEVLRGVGEIDYLWMRT